MADGERGDDSGRAGGRRRRPRWRRVALALVALVGLVIAAGAAYFAIPQPELPEAAAAQQSTADVAFTIEDGRLAFVPTDRQPTTGLIVYPGGKVSAGAYAPLARAIAAEGYLVVIVPMPLNLAVLGIDRAREVIDVHPEIETWAIGGHSLGGAMAAQYAATDDRIRALALWAAFSATDLSDRNLDVLVVYGSLDAGAAGFASDERLANLPPTRTVEVIEGGNHEQMGWYTGQPNDPPATIGRAAQQEQVVEATVELLAAVEALAAVQVAG